MIKFKPLFMHFYVSLPIRILKKNIPKKGSFFSSWSPSGVSAYSTYEKQRRWWFPSTLRLVQGKEKNTFVYITYLYFFIRGVTSLGKMLGIRKIRDLNLHLRFGRVSLTLVVSNLSITNSWKKWKSLLQKVLLWR